MIRNLFLRLMGGGAIVAAALLVLPALSRPAAEEEKPLGKLSPDLALVPRDAPWFVSVRPADLMKHPGLKAVKELREFAPFFEGMEMGLGVAPEGVERITMFTRRFSSGPPVVIIRAFKPYDKEKVKKALHAGDEAKAHGKTIFATPGRWGQALWLADDRTFVFAQPGALVPYLAAIEKPGKTHPLAEELKVADGKHSLTAAFLPRLLARTMEAEERAWRKPRPTFERIEGPEIAPPPPPPPPPAKGKVGALGRGESYVVFQKERPFRDGKDGPRRFNASDYKEEPLALKSFEEAMDPSGPSRGSFFFALPALRCQRALVTVDVAAQVKANLRAVYTSEADAKDGLAAADMLRLIGREAATLTPARRKEHPLAAAALEPVRVALKDAEIKRDGKVVTASLEIKPDLVSLFKAAATGGFGPGFGFGGSGKPPSKDARKDFPRKEKPIRADDKKK